MRMGMKKLARNNNNAAKHENKKQGGLRAGKKGEQTPNFMLPPPGPDQTFAREEDVIDGTYLIYALDVSDEIYNVKGGDYKGYVKGHFCKLDLSPQKEDPSKGTWLFFSSTLVRQII